MRCLRESGRIGLVACLVGGALGCADEVPQQERRAIDAVAAESAASDGALDAVAWPERLGLERALAERDPRYQPVLEGGGVSVAQPGGPSARVEASGASVTIGAHEARVRVSAIGRGDARVSLAEAAPAIEGAEVQREVAPGITDWWRALPSGLEHGVTIAERPIGEGALVIEVAIEGLDTRAVSDSGASLVDASGARVATYASLLVLDADGMRAPARMSVASGAVRIDVDDREARYPLVVDPILASEEATLLASGGAANDSFGGSVALSADGTRALVGARSDETAAGAYAGSARVFVRAGSSWTEEATLLALGGAAGDRFGASVALSADGSRALVGALQDDTAGGADAGSARVFARAGSSWTEEATLLASGGAGSDYFGSSVALSADGSRALVGALQDDTAGGADAGSARVFVRAGSSWTEEATLLASGGAGSDYFGSSVALSADGSRALVGALYDDTAGGTDAGSARVFLRAGSSWTEEATLLASDAAEYQFGFTVALSADGSRALVGAPLAGLDAGSARVFLRVGTSWTEEATFLGRDGDLFGASVALTVDGSRAVVGALYDAAGGVDAGSARVFVRVGTSWTEQATLLASGGAALDAFGRSVGLSGDGTRAIVGAPDDDTAAGTNAGSARVFTLLAIDGTACATATACASGSCVDGVCCASACGGGAVDCQACSVAAGGTTDGTCTSLAMAVAPTVTCRASAGDCDVAEICSAASTTCPADSFAPSITECRASAGVCDLAEACTGASAVCPGDAVAPSTTTCRASTGECDLVEGCSGVSAVCPADAAQPAGTPCGGALSGECDAQDVCSGGVGASATCEARVALAGTSCRAASCTAATETLATSCDGASAACPAPVVNACAPYTCGANACGTRCGTDDECASGSYCDATVCRPLLAAGGVCASSNACGSGHCVDGVCCASACDGQCEACDAAGSEGSCVPVTGDPRNGRAGCASDGDECGGRCDGITTASCTYPDASVECGGWCTDGTQIEAGACDGAGACGAGASTACAPYACGDDACLTACTGHGDCAPGHVCDASACVLSDRDGGVSDGGMARDGSVNDGGGDAGMTTSAGCGCAVPAQSGDVPVALLVMLGLALRRRARGAPRAIARSSGSPVPPCEPTCARSIEPWASRAARSSRSQSASTPHRAETKATDA